MNGELSAVPATAVITRVPGTGAALLPTGGVNVTVNGTGAPVRSGTVPESGCPIVKKAVSWPVPSAMLAIW